jgi:hypothetical protein
MDTEYYIDFLLFGRDKQKIVGLRLGSGLGLLGAPKNGQKRGIFMPYLNSVTIVGSAGAIPEQRQERRFRVAGQAGES